MVRIQVTARDSVNVVAASTWLLRTIRRRHPRDFAWQRGNGIEELSGTRAFRRAIERGSVTEVLARWERESREFLQAAAPYWLY
jgi:uncharacterized protein YbbC (DUF1343 family)